MKASAYLTLAVAATLTALPATGQNLEKEVVVERQVTPAERAATRPSAVKPDVLAPQINQRQLQMAEYGGVGQLTRRVSMLEPAPWADTLAVSPWRGYASLGYLPAFNAQASLGYRFVDTKATTVDAWMQYDGISYKYDGRSLHNNSASIGAYLQQRWRPGTMTLQGSFTLGAIGQMLGNFSDLDQTVMGANIQGTWQSDLSKPLEWHAGANAGYFNFDKRVPTSILQQIVGTANMPPDYEMPANAETLWGISVGASYRIDHNQRIGLDYDMQYRHVHYYAPVPNGFDTRLWYDADGSSYGIVAFKPRYDLTVDRVLQLQLGANLQICPGKDAGKTFVVAPDVKATLDVTQQFAVWGRATGGKYFNTMRSRYRYCPYSMLSSFSYTPTNVSHDIEFGINIGPVEGLTASLSVGNARATNWLMPVSLHGVDVFMPCTIKGWRYAVEVAWSWRDIVGVQGSIAGAQDDEGQGYYRWRDNAHIVAGAGAWCRPIRGLKVGVNWRLRSGRHAYALSTVDTELATPYIIDGWQATRISLGDASDLQLTARYELNRQWTLFADIENLLCNHWRETPGIRSPGIHGLVGAALKF